MSFSINRATLLGNVTKDPEIRYTAGGTAVAKFGVATNESIKDKQTNEWKDVPTFHNIVVFGNRAEWVASNLLKGLKVYVEGRINNRSWEDQNGVKKYTSEIVADEVIAMSKTTPRNDSRGVDEEEQPQTQPANPDLDDALGDIGADFDNWAKENPPTTTPAKEPEQPKKTPAKKKPEVEKQPEDDIPA